MPKDNNITNSQVQGQATNPEADAHHHNMPGDTSAPNDLGGKARPAAGPVDQPKSAEVNKGVPNQANTGEPE